LRLPVMNHPLLELPLLKVEAHQVREVLRCLLHTILFHRALGLVRPRDVDMELFDVTYVQCGDAKIERRVEEKVESFCSYVERRQQTAGQAAFSAQVALSFYGALTRACVLAACARCADLCVRAFSRPWARLRTSLA